MARKKVAGGPKGYQKNKKRLERDLNNLNRIRNSVMHPIKEWKYSEDDFEFVRRIFRLFGAIDFR